MDTWILGNVYESASQSAYTEHGMQGREEFEFEISPKGKKPEQDTQQVTQQENKTEAVRKVGLKQHKAGKRGLVVETQSNGQYASVQMRNGEEQRWK